MLLLNSLIIIFLTVSFQCFPYGRCLDFVTPLLVAAGLTLPRKKALLWVVAMSIIMSPLTRYSFVLIAAFWVLVVLVVNYLSSKIRWDVLTAGLVIAPVSSFTWYFLLLISTWIFQYTPTLDSQVYFSFLLRPVSSGVFTILFWTMLTGKSRSYHPLSLREEKYKYFLTHS